MYNFPLLFAIMFGSILLILIVAIYFLLRKGAKEDRSGEKRWEAWTEQKRASLRRPRDMYVARKQLPLDEYESHLGGDILDSSQTN